jgi:hypothetical protein
MDIDTLLTEMARQGRNAGPMLLNKYWPELNTDDRKAALLDTWILAEWPAQALPWQIWLHYFKQVGFVSDDPNIKKPQQPLTIYRGAVKHKRKGMSWTQNKELAVWFANRFDNNSSRGYLYQAIVEPDQFYKPGNINGNFKQKKSGEYCRPRLQYINLTDKGHEYFKKLTS